MSMDFRDDLDFSAGEGQCDQLVRESGTQYIWTLFGAYDGEGKLLGEGGGKCSAWTDGGDGL